MRVTVLILTVSFEKPSSSNDRLFKHKYVEKNILHFRFHIEIKEKWLFKKKIFFLPPTLIMHLLAKNICILYKRKKFSGSKIRSDICGRGKNVGKEEKSLYSYEKKRLFRRL